MNQFKVIINGTRTFDNYDLLERACNKILAKYKMKYQIVILSGTAKGADSLGEQYAHKKGYTIERYPADWSLGKSAGIQRNMKMGRDAHALISFWDGSSKGTKHMINFMRQANKSVAVIKFTQD